MKQPNKKFLFFLLLLSSQLFADLEQLVVKVTSKKCESPTEFRGSGILFQHEGKAFVLTSDHVVIHNYQGSTCHRVYYKEDSLLGVPSKPAEYRTSDWGMGLALLKVPDLKLDKSWPTLEDLKGVEAKPGDPVEIVGYPADSFISFSDPRGKIRDLAKPVSIFAQLPNLIQIEDADGEFGMSGGAVFRSGKYLGMLSHQNLSGGQNALFAIPASEIYKWLKEAIKEEAFFKPYLYQGESAQLENRDQVSSADFSYDYAVQESFHHHLKIKSIIIHKFASLSYKAFRDPYGRLEKVAQFLQHHPTNIQLRYFRRSSFPFKEAELEGIGSFVEFFINVQNKEILPIFVLPPPDESDWKDALNIRTIANTLLIESKKMGSESKIKKYLEGLSYWLTQIPDSIESLDERWMIVRIEDIDYLLQSEEFKAELTEKTRNNLLKIKDLLKTFLPS